MDLAQNSITVADVFYDHADCGQIEDLIQLLVLNDHLLVYAVQMLGTAGDVVLHVHLVQGFSDLLDDLVDELYPLLLLLRHFDLQRVVLLRMQVF